MFNPDEIIMKEMDYKTFAKMIANIPSCIFYKDCDLKYRFSSHYWAQLSSNDIVGKTDLDIRKDKENALLAMEADRMILKEKKGCSYVIKSDIDGQVSYLELIKAPVIGEDGEAKGIVGLINDITDKVLMEQQIREMSKKLEEQCNDLEASNNELKTTLEKVEKMHNSHKLFSASMNHELRSPLNGIIGVLQLLMEDESLSEIQHDGVSNAYQSSQYMLKIVNEWLDYAKMETNEFRIKHEKFNLRECVNNINFMARNLASGKGLVFEMNFDSGNIEEFVGDETRIYQIMHNFVSNSIKYTEAGRVTLNVIYDEGRLTIACSDTGQGMSVESLKRVFDPFARFNEQKNAGIEGTGLGLSIVKRIIDQMEGDIDVKSKLGEGTTMSAVIPLDIYMASESDEADTPERDYSTLKALCVDDTSVNVTIIKSLLKKKGVEADGVLSGIEAIELAGRNEYDIIFMDHQMPGMDGIETFRNIRDKSLKNRSTPVVMLTGNVDACYEEFYRENGLDAYLAKPVIIDDLFKTIDKVCF